jgi:hypothetical protein
MNDGFLEAGCVIENLVAAGFIERANWKHNTKERYYSSTFTVSGTRSSLVDFEITVTGGVHCITKSIVRILARRYRRDFTVILDTCALQS